MRGQVEGFVMDFDQTHVAKVEASGLAVVDAFFQLVQFQKPNGGNRHCQIYQNTWTKPITNTRGMKKQLNYEK